MDTRKVRWNFPYVESNRNSTNRELYTWDYRNRLTSVTQQEFNTETQEWTTVQTIEYTYDYNNVWIRKILDSNGDGTADSKSIFIPENYQTTVQIDNGTVTHHYLWTPNAQDKLLADVTNTEILWSLTDHLGSIRDIIQSTATGVITQAHIIYDAYGNVISCKNSTGETISNPILFAYTGKAFDTSTSLQNNINRWYDSTTGRWLSQDPIGFEGNDTNLYRYVGNKSFIATDSMGLWLKMSGQNDLWMAEEGDTFSQLVPLVNKNLDAIANQYCVIPKPQKRKYVVDPIYQGKTNPHVKEKRTSADEETMQAAWQKGKPATCGVYDAKNLTAETGESLRMSVGYDYNLKGKRTHGFIYTANFYVGLRQRNLTEKEVYNQIRVTSKEGRKPIGMLEIIGHSGEGLNMIGSQNGEVSHLFTLETIRKLAAPISLTGRRTWEDAKMGKMPIIGWFTTNAQVRFIGCSTSTLASNFAKTYLRGNSFAMGTNVHIGYRNGQFGYEIPIQSEWQSIQMGYFFVPAQFANIASLWSSYSASN